MHRDLMLHILNMCDRSVRAAIGFSVDTCIRYKLLPCPLVYCNSLFTRRLHFLLKMRLRKKFVHVWYPEAGVMAFVTFDFASLDTFLTVIRNVKKVTPTNLSADQFVVFDSALLPCWWSE